MMPRTPARVLRGIFFFNRQKEDTMEGQEIMVETVKHPQVVEWTADQVELIKRTVANGATNDELKLFLYTAKRSGLDPLARQIHAVKRAGKMVIQTAIDGYRLIADRTGKYAGNDDPVFDNEENPRVASVSVWKLVEGVRCEFKATARWDQYFPGEAQGFMWRKMPHLMLGKCAEALALRKAFPAELSGLYTNDEMEQAGRPQGQQPEVAMPERGAPDPVDSEAPASDQGQVRKISIKQVARFYALCKVGGKTSELFCKYLSDKIGSEKAEDITVDLYEEICKWAESK
jgi:phage recombination protein Bet